MNCRNHRQREQAKGADRLQPRDYTLAAARGLAKLAPSEEVDQQLVAIAQRQLADKFAPLKTRMMADLLFTRRQMVRLEEDPVQQQEVIGQFLGRYPVPAVVADALMLGVEMSKMINLPPGDARGERSVKAWQQTLVDQLERDHKDRADVKSTLNTMERRPLHYLPFKTKFKMQDGSTWLLPRDVLGRMTTLHFWGEGNKGPLGWAASVNDKIDRPDMGGYGTTFPALIANGAEFHGIYLGTERSEMENAIKEQKMFWPQIPPASGSHGTMFSSSWTKPIHTVKRKNRNSCAPKRKRITIP